jgi:hypothetical protein
VVGDPEGTGGEQLYLLGLEVAADVRKQGLEPVLEVDDSAHVPARDEFAQWIGL